MSTKSGFSRSRSFAYVRGTRLNLKRRQRLTGLPGRGQIAEQVTVFTKSLPECRRQPTWRLLQSRTTASLIKRWLQVWQLGRKPPPRKKARSKRPVAKELSALNPTGSVSTRDKATCPKRLAKAIRSFGRQNRR